MEYFCLNNCKRYLKIYGKRYDVKKEYTTYLLSDNFIDINDYIMYSDNMDILS